MIKLALTGKIRSGKDSVAEYLVEKHYFAHFAFGDGIRDVCHRLFPDQMMKDKKPRSLLQNVAQYMRQIDPDVWVKSCFREIETYKEMSNRNIVVADLRQPNEHEYLKENGFVVVRVSCSDDIRIARMNASGDKFDTKDLNHETERYVDSFEVDYEILNEGTLDDLYKQVDALMKSLKFGD